MEPTLEPRTEPAAARHAGPSLPIVAAVSLALLVASLVAIGVLTGGHLPSPYGPLAPSAAFFTDHRGAMALGAFFTLGSAIPLAIYTATVASRLQFLRISAAGVHIALVGGVAASVLLAVSGLASWVLSQPGVADAAAVRVLHLFLFAAGGPGHVAMLGLLVAGIAVTAGITRRVSRGVMISGIVIAAIAELSTLTLVTPLAAYLLPLARFPALIWLIVAGAALPASRGGAVTAA
jgi:hypothetical protein